MHTCITYIKLVGSLARHTAELEALSDKLEGLQAQQAWEDVRAVLAEHAAKNEEIQKIDDAIRLYDPARVPSTP